MPHPDCASLHGLVGPAMLQALQLARYQALRNIGRNTVSAADENDVISQKPTPEEERIMASNAAVVSALEDIFSWMHKDKTSRSSRLSYVESWRFRRALYRVWIVSTLYGYGRVVRGERVTGSSSESQRAFLSNFTSQELIQISKVCTFLKLLASWVILAERKLVGSLEVYDFDALYLFAGPHIILRCYEEQSSDPLPTSYLLDEEDYEKFLLPTVGDILSRRKASVPSAFVGSILDEVCGTEDKCRACGRDGRTYLPPSIPCTPELYNENNWTLLKGWLGLPSEIFLKLPSNIVEKPLFKTLDEANYDTLFRELFARRSDPYKEWTKQDWVCQDCIREFFRTTVLQWWCERKARGGESVPQNCQHGYYCKDQCFEAGIKHARQFNHACEPVDLGASLAYHWQRQ